MAKTERVGVYGGTFDPIHSTHLAIAEAAMAQAKLDRILFVVAQCPPHKQDDVYAPAEERFAMVARAVESHKQFHASRLEMDREGPSYTADTLSQIRASHSDAKLFLIVGADSLVDLPRWHAPHTILELATLLVVPRPDSIKVIPDTLLNHVEWLAFEESALSSTTLRQMIASGEDPGAMLPPVVQEYIEEKGLYRAHCEDTP